MKREKEVVGLERRCDSVGLDPFGRKGKGEDFEKHCVSVPSATRPGRPVGLGAGCC